MRKTSVRRFIHAVLDVLPLLIIPIFALNILHKETEPISIEVQEKISVNFNQLVKNGNVTKNSDWYSYPQPSTTTGNATITYYEGYVKLTSSGNIYNNGIGISLTQIESNHKLLINIDIQSDELHNNTTQSLLMPYFQGSFVYGTPIGASVITDSWQTIQTIYTTENTNTNFYIFINNGTLPNTYKFTNFEIFDLTKMGLENLSINEFNNLFPNSYYNYTESQKMLVNKPSPTTYNSTDIGSQFIYALYKPVNDYFNFNNLFNMNNVWEWIQLNLFQGSTPLPVFMVWNIILYEFFMDLIFLMYSLFMFIIDWSTNMIDKFLYKSRS